MLARNFLRPSATLPPSFLPYTPNHPRRIRLELIFPSPRNTASFLFSFISELQGEEGTRERKPSGKERDRSAFTLIFPGTRDLINRITPGLMKSGLPPHRRVHSRPLVAHRQRYQRKNGNICREYFSASPPVPSFEPPGAVTPPRNCLANR